MRARLVTAWPNQRFEIVKIETAGDKVLDRPLPEIGGKGLFTEELEAALLAGDVDMAVHSLKDLPTELPEALKVGAVCERADPRDAWVARKDGAGTPALAAPGARIGTSSERRRAQVLALRPDLEVASVRGNVETRLRKLDEGQYDALIVAAAGLVRLGLLERVTSFLEAPAWLPAAGQGALAVESRADGSVTDRLLVAIEDPVARAETDSERALLATLQGGCQVPVGARARAEGEDLVLHALVVAADGAQLVRAEGRGRRERAVELGIEVAHDLLSRGGEAIVAAFRKPKR